MCAAQFISPQSNDFDMYIPLEMDIEDGLFCPPADSLTHSIDFDFMPSAHRIDSELFNQITDDQAALSAFMVGELCNNNFDTNDLNNYLHEQSRVVPHIPRESPMNYPLSPSSTMSPPNSPLQSRSIDIRKFLVFDEAAGRERRPLLHEFIRLLLENDEYSHIAEYTNRKQGIFKLHKPKDVSELWKHVKGRNSDNSKSYFLIKNICLSNYISFSRNDL